MTQFGLVTANFLGLRAHLALLANTPLDKDTFHKPATLLNAPVVFIELDTTRLLSTPIFVWNHNRATGDMTASHIDYLEGAGVPLVTCLGLGLQNVPLLDILSSKGSPSFSDWVNMVLPFWGLDGSNHIPCFSGLVSDQVRAFNRAKASATSLIPSRRSYTPEQAMKELVEAFNVSLPKLSGHKVYPIPQDVPKVKAPRLQQVYAIGDTDNGVVKIGVSDKPLNRLASLQTAYPYRLDLLAASTPRNDAVAVERHLHSLLADFRLAGEWFDLMAYQMIDWTSID